MLNRNLDFTDKLVSYYNINLGEFPGAFVLCYLNEKVSPALLKIWRVELEEVEVYTQSRLDSKSYQAVLKTAQQSSVNHA